METKELLVNALCGYMPHRVMVELKNDKDPYELLGFHCNDKNIATIGLKFGDMYATQKVHLDEIKPYLRPIESMTDDEKTELIKHVCPGGGTDYFKVLDDGEIDRIDSYDIHRICFGTTTTLRYIGWFIRNKIDCFGLIKEGLAVTAPEGMYDFK